MTVLKREDDPQLSREASLAFSAFRLGVAAEQKASHAAGVAYPASDGAGGVIWLHPDGLWRRGMDAGSEAID